MAVLAKKKAKSASFREALSSSFMPGAKAGNVNLQVKKKGFLYQDLLRKLSERVEIFNWGELDSNVVVYPSLES